MSSEVKTKTAAAADESFSDFLDTDVTSMSMSSSRDRLARSIVPACSQYAGEARANKISERIIAVPAIDGRAQLIFKSLETAEIGDARFFIPRSLRFILGLT